MTDAPKHKGLYAALAAAQAEMGRAMKDVTNPAFRTKYADLTSVMDACMPALSKHGIALLQPAYDDESGRYVKTVFVHGDTGETVECRVPLIIGKNDMQGYGSAVTYARRYGLMGMAGIAPEDDDGNAAVAAKPTSEQDRQRGPSAMDVACESLGNAETMEQLAAIFADLPKSVKGEKVVIAAKNKRKAELTVPSTNADLGMDKIPF